MRVWKIKSDEAALRRTTKTWGIQEHKRKDSEEVTIIRISWAYEERCSRVKALRNEMVQPI